jgi:hypothetical protein
MAGGKRSEFDKGRGRQDRDLVTHPAFTLLNRNVPAAEAIRPITLNEGDRQIPMAELTGLLPTQECHINTGVEAVQPGTDLGQGAAHLFSIAIDVAFYVDAPMLVVGQDTLLRHEDSEFAIHRYLLRLGARD